MDGCTSVRKSEEQDGSIQSKVEARLREVVPGFFSNRIPRGKLEQWPPSSRWPLSVVSVWPKADHHRRILQSFVPSFEPAS